MSGQRGFAAVEALVALGLLMTVSAAAIGLVVPAQGFTQAHLEASDVMQRVRTTADALGHDLAGAGAGPHAGVRAGALTKQVPAVFPYRRTARNPDPPGTVRSDTITLWMVPPGLGGTRLTAGAAAGATELHVEGQMSCGAGARLCDFVAGGTALLVDESGAHELLVLSAVSDGALLLQHAGQPLTRAFLAGASVLPLVARVYGSRYDSATGAFQLTMADAATGVDQPVVDHLVSVQFEYAGEPGAPRLLTPVDPFETTYAPPPPGPGDSVPGFAPGENCVFRRESAEGPPVSRLADLGPPDGPFVSLDPAMLADGPWCPDGASSVRVDADLLRIRRVTVTLRFQAASSALRGPAGMLYATGGTGAGARSTPDAVARVTVTPRNLVVAR